MNILRGIQGRIGAAIGAVFASVCFLAFGAFLAFFISPQQAMEWRRIDGLPQMDAANYAATAAGEEVVISGYLQDNEVLTEEGLVAYIQERWDVKSPSSDDDKPSGSWTTIKSVMPTLTVAFDGGTITFASNNAAIVSGSLHDGSLVYGSGSLTASYNGQQLPDGSVRTRGFFNGDLVTAVGRKASTGDLTPNRLFGGDREQLVESIRSGARIALIAGLAMMICSPFVLVFGVLGGLFGRKR